MSQTYTVTTTDEEQAALEWVAAQAEPAQDPAIYFDARMHEVLHSYVVQYGVATSQASPQEVALAYVQAAPLTQVRVNVLLGVETSKR